MLFLAVAVVCGVGYLCLGAHERARRRGRPRRPPAKRAPMRRMPATVPAAPPRIFPNPFAPRVAAPVPPPPPSVRREVLADDPVEHQLLAELRRDPASGETRMVYADLLEQRGELPKANFVRGTDRDDDPVDILETSDFAWRAIASRDRVECGRTTCPQLWELCVPDREDERRRECFLCKKAVRYVATIAEERACFERGERAVVDLGGAPRRR